MAVPPRSTMTELQHQDNDLAVSVAQVGTQFAQSEGQIVDVVDGEWISSGVI
jgi:hypothetical protein